MSTRDRIRTHNEEWKAFSKQVEQFHLEGTELLRKYENAESQIQKEQLEQEINAWDKSCDTYILEQFDPNFNVFYEIYTDDEYEAYGSLIQIQADNPFIKDTKYKITVLKSYLNMCEALFSSEIQDFLKTAKRPFSSHDIIEFILYVLYPIHNGTFHSVTMILLLGNMPFHRYEEVQEMAEHLTKKGFAEKGRSRRYSEDRVLQITVKGRVYVERKRKALSAEKKKQTVSLEAMSSKIDEVLDHVTKLGFGQDILFEEMQELKELYGKVDKKTWSQVLKGKLLDMGIEKVIDNETISYIYNQLIDKKLELPL